MALETVFNTSNVMDNEIIKANDFNFAFEKLIENVAISTQMMLESTQDFVINGKVSPIPGTMGVKVAPIYGVCKSTGMPFGNTAEDTDIEYLFDAAPNGRVDILEVQGDWEEYDTQQRAFNDPDTDTQTYSYVQTKKRLIPKYQIKKGVDGTSVAPTTDSGWVKLAEVHIYSDTLALTDDNIKNITADVAGMDNDDWTTEKDKTYNIGYISDVNARFRVQHEEDGTHSDNCINQDSLDIGTGSKQINANILPIGGSVTIPSQSAISSTDSILSVITKAVAVITNLYNNYLKFGTYGFEGEVQISASDTSDVLDKPLKLSADGLGSATVKIGETTVLSIDTTGKIHASYNSLLNTDNGYTLVTKAITDALNTAIGNLDTRVTNIENTSDTTVYANGTLSAGTDGRYNTDPVPIYLATTDNVTLSGTQSSSAMDNVSTVTDGVYILVKAQTNAKQNGIYQYSSNSNWNRVNDYLSPNTLKGKLFTVQNGTANGKRMFYLPRVNFTDGSDFGSDDILFSEYFGSNMPIANRHVLRDSNGCAKVAEPNSPSDAATKSYVDPVLIQNDSANNIKVVTGAPALKSDMSIKFFFTTTMTGTDTSTGMKISYNGSVIDLKAVKGGSLVDVKAHELTAGTYTYIQAYTTLEVIYNGGNFVIVGNPIVLSGNDYTIYADGKIGNENIGDIKPKSTNDIPYGWLEANGQAISRTKYAELFQKYSTQTYDSDLTHTLLSRYGTGDGSTTFNLPDYREVALVGIGTNGTDTEITSTNSHDAFTLGQFGNDQVQDHVHKITDINNNNVGTVSVATGGYSGILEITNQSGAIDANTIFKGRHGDVTRGKRKGVNFLIKVM